MVFHLKLYIKLLVSRVKVSEGTGPGETNFAVSSSHVYCNCVFINRRYNLMNKPKHSVSHFLLHMQYLKEIKYRRTRHMFALIYLLQIMIKLLRFELSFSNACNNGCKLLSIFPYHKKLIKYYCIFLKTCLKCSMSVGDDFSRKKYDSIYTPIFA